MSLLHNMASRRSESPWELVSRSHINEPPGPRILITEVDDDAIATLQPRSLVGHLGKAILRCLQIAERALASAPGKMNLDVESQTLKGSGRESCPNLPTDLLTLHYCWSLPGAICYGWGC